MKTLLIITIYFSFTVTAFAQQPVDSGFTNKKEARNKMVGGLKEGKWVEYYTIEKSFEKPTRDTTLGVIYRLTEYKFGKQMGVVRTYNKNGTIKEEATFDNGKQNGITKEYENKVLVSEIPYVDGKKNGIGKEYYKSGKVKSEVKYKNDKVSGTKNFDESGNEIK